MLFSFKLSVTPYKLCVTPWLKNYFEKTNLIIRFGAIAALPLILFSNCCKPKKPKPNVIFILLDDFGYTDLGCYGSKFYETPNIDRLASARVSSSLMLMQHALYRLQHGLQL